MKDIKSLNKKHLGMHTSDTFHVSQQIMYLNYLNQTRIPLAAINPAARSISALNTWLANYF
jgi:hypothetical protein